MCNIAYRIYFILVSQVISVFDSFVKKGNNNNEWFTQLIDHIAPRRL